ncbi:MAG: SIR2 family protein [Alphaproteobacteria bacterium]|nr:SIR2 family protein [Alphaproteobacteria bacterium]
MYNHRLQADDSHQEQLALANRATARTQEERVIALGPGLTPIPERLLLAHAQGKVLFLAGAGISLPAGLPDFRDLVVRVYGRLDPMVHGIIRDIPRTACNQWLPNISGLNDQQTAEVKRFISGDYDVVLGMLERRFDSPNFEGRRVREEVRDQLLHRGIKPAGIHKTLVRLADRGGATAIATTNFDLLLEDAARQMRTDVQSYSLGSIPRPGLRRDFAGIFHIHGALERDIKKISDLIISDRDFGEFYLRRRVVPDFIYDAARLYHLVLIGYSANDPPMRYLFNAVAADGTRFNDLKERFTFFGTSA